MELAGILDLDDFKEREEEKWKTIKKAGYSEACYCTWQIVSVCGVGASCRKKDCKPLFLFKALFLFFLTLHPKERENVNSEHHIIFQ